MSGRSAPSGVGDPADTHVETVEWLLEAGSAEEYHTRLDRFCSHTLVPLVDRLIARRLRTPYGGRNHGGERPLESEAHDIRSDTLHRLLRALTKAWGLKSQAGADSNLPIRNLEAYAQRALDNARVDRTRPNAWRQFEYQIRRLIELHPQLELWKGTEGRTVVGRASFSQRNPSSVPFSVAADFLTQHRPALERAATSHLPQAPVILAVLDCARGPVFLDDVLSILAVFYRLEMPREVALPESDNTPDGAGRLSQSARNSLETSVIDKETLHRCWTAIEQMPPAWRQVLILGNDDLLALLVISSVATMESAAAAVGLTECELAALFPAIPLPDDEIARRLGITVGAVRNMRWQARKSLQSIFAERDERTRPTK